MLLEFGADPNLTLEIAKSERPFSKDERVKSIPLWARFLVLVFSDPGFSDHTEAYIQALDKLLAKADFETASEGLNSLCEDLGVKQLSNKGEKPMMTARCTVFRTVASSLRRTSEASACKNYTYPYFKLLAKATGIFLTHAAHPSIPTAQIQSNICQIFPPSLSNYLLDVIRSNYPAAENIRSKGRKRGNVLDKGYEDNAGRAKAARRKPKR